MGCEKKIISWINEACIKDVAEAIRTSDSAKQAATYLDKLYVSASKRSKAITRSSVLGGLRRSGTSKAMLRLYPIEGDALLKKFTKKERAQHITKSLRQKRVRRPLRIKTPRSTDSARSNRPLASLNELEKRKEEVKKLKPLLVDGKPATVTTLQEKQCRYIIGEPGDKDFGLCGRPVSKEPYCDDHRVLAYVSASKRAGSQRVERFLDQRALKHACRTRER